MAASLRAPAGGNSLTPSWPPGYFVTLLPAATRPWVLFTRPPRPVRSRGWVDSSRESPHLCLWSCIRTRRPVEPQPPPAPPRLSPPQTRMPPPPPPLGRQRRGPARTVAANTDTAVARHGLNEPGAHERRPYRRAAFHWLPGGEPSLSDDLGRSAVGRRSGGRGGGEEGRGRPILATADPWLRHTSRVPRLERGGGGPTV